MRGSRVELGVAGVNLEVWIKGGGTLRNFEGMKVSVEFEIALEWSCGFWKGGDAFTSRVTFLEG